MSTNTNVALAMSRNIGFASERAKRLGPSRRRHNGASRGVTPAETMLEVTSQTYWGG